MRLRGFPHNFFHEKKSCSAVEKMSIRVPRDAPTIAEAVHIAREHYHTSRTRPTIILSGGIHKIDVYDSTEGHPLNYVRLDFPLLIDGDRDRVSTPTIIHGGFLVTEPPQQQRLEGEAKSTEFTLGSLHQSVCFRRLTIQDSLDSAIHSFYSTTLPINVMSCSIADCEGRGIVVQGPGVRGTVAGTTVERCIMSGISALDGAEIIVSCISSTLVAKKGSTSGATGAATTTAAKEEDCVRCTCPMVIHAGRTRVENNCMGGYSEDYGLEVGSRESTIRLLRPLVKECVSGSNGGGGDWGGPGSIDSMSPDLLEDDVIHVPDEESTLCGALSRARESDGRVTKIVLKYGRHLVGDVDKDKYVEVDFAPIEIVGAGVGRTVVVGGFKVTGKKTVLGHGVVLRGMSIVDSRGSGVFGENGLAVRVEKCSISGCNAYGVAIQRTQGELVDCLIERCSFSGIFAAYGGKVTVSGMKSRVAGNCVRERMMDYGVRCHGKSSQVLIESSLKRAEVSVENLGGGNYGAN